MIGHDDKSVQDITMKVGRSSLERTNDARGDPRVLEPERAGRGDVEYRVRLLEFFACGTCDVLPLQCLWPSRKRAI